MKIRNLLSSASLFASAALAVSAFALIGEVPEASAQQTATARLTPASATVLHRHTSGPDGFATHSYWYDTGKEVVVFDGQFTPALAEKVIADITRQTKSPIKYLVITHPNPDKFNGASAFKKVGAKIVASASTAKAIPGVHAYKKYYFTKMAKMFTDATYPREAKVDMTFTGKLSLPLQAGEVRLQELSHRGVSSTQTVAFIPAAKALVVGDLVHYKAHAWLEGGIEAGKPHPDLGEWQRALDELLAFSGATVYGGRGESAPVAVAVAEEKRYLSGLDSLVTKYVQALGARKSELNGAKAGQHFKAIAAQAQKAFPDYQLPFMVEYGVYGLAGSK